jgi:uncharacterized membrane protein YhaH (DUF805 family)
MFDFYADYYSFSGRASRLEYLIFHIIQAIGYALVGLAMRYLIAGILGIDMSELNNLKGGHLPNISLGGAGMTMIVLIGFLIFNFFVFTLPWIATTVRRMHDLNLSGWYFLLIFIVLLALSMSVAPISSITKISPDFLTKTWQLSALLFTAILFLKRGSEGMNKFGGDPVELARYIRQRKAEKKHG